PEWVVALGGASRVAAAGNTGVGVVATLNKPDLVLRPTPTTVSPAAGTSPIDSLAPRIRRLVLRGHQPDDGYQSRSEVDQAVVFGMVQTGWSLDQIVDCFERHPIGAKYRERHSRGRRYLESAVANAQSFEPAER